MRDRRQVSLRLHRAQPMHGATTMDEGHQVLIVNPSYVAFCSDMRLKQAQTARCASTGQLQIPRAGRRGAAALVLLESWAVSVASHDLLQCTAVGCLD